MDFGICGRFVIEQSVDRSRPSVSMTSSTFKMVVAIMLSRVLGMVREQVMAFYFGVSGVMDAFLVAYRIPLLMRDIFAEGGLALAFIPIFTEKLQAKPHMARSFLWTFFVCLLIVVGIVTLIIALAAPSIVNVFAPNFHRDPERFQLTVLMVRIMSPFLILVSLSALFMGTLNALKVFFIPTFSSAAVNVAVISSALVAGWAIGQGEVWGLVIPLFLLPLGFVWEDHCRY